MNIPPSAYEIEGLNDEIKRIIIDKVRFTEKDYPLKIKPSSTTSVSIIEIQQD